MFEYVSSKSPEVNQVFCLLCTSIIASNGGYSADLVHTELANRSGYIAQYYRAYYTLIAGDFNEKTKGTIDGMSVRSYNEFYYDKMALKYNAKNGKDSFNQLSEEERFNLVFLNALLPTVVSTVGGSLKSVGLSDEEIDKLGKIFMKEFSVKFYCVIEELLTLNSTPTALWSGLYDYALDMPHVIIGLRKQVSALDPKFFRDNKDNLDSLIPYMRSRTDLHFSGYRDRLSIAGVIVNHFKMHLAKSWRGEYAGLIASSNSTFTDDDGVLLFASELQEKMFSSSTSTKIRDFEGLMRTIDIGSQLYDVAHARYYNLIAWRQNKIKQQMIERLKNLPISAKLENIGLTIGGYMNEHDISDTVGIGNGDKRIRFENLDRMITEAYDSNIDSEIARKLIDKWFADGVRASETGDSKCGRYPMNFKLKRDFNSYNKGRFKELIQGVQALKVLESEILKMDYTFMSFPVYGHKGRPYELLTGVNLTDYLNYKISIDEDIVIESDIEPEAEIGYSPIIDNISAKASEMNRSLSTQSVVSKISWDSLTDDELALTVNKEADRELLRFLKHKGIQLSITEELEKSSIHDVVFESIERSAKESINENILSISKYFDRLKGLQTKTSNVTTGCYLTKIRYIAWVISLYCVYGRLTYGISSNADNAYDSYQVDSDGNFMSICDFYEAGITKENLAKLVGHDISDEEFNQLKQALFCEQSIQYSLWKSKYIGDRFNKVPAIFMSDGRETNLFKFLSTIIPYSSSISNCTKMQYEVVKDICRNLTTTTNKIADTKLDENDALYLPRAICFGVNVKVVLEHLIAALVGVANNFLNINDIDVDTNSDDMVNVRLLLKNLKAIDTLYPKPHGIDKFRALKAYEDVYGTLFESINYDTNALKRDDKFNYKRFVFLDSIQRFNLGYDDIDEKLLQYSEVTKLVHLILTNGSMYRIKLGNSTYSILQFIDILDDILSLERKHQDDEYLVDRVSITTIGEDVQRDIERKLAHFISAHPEECEIDESATWIDNVKEYCDRYSMPIGQNILSSIQLNYNRYSINEHRLVTFDNKVVHTTVYSNNETYKAVVTRYGIFGYNGEGLFPIRKVKDYKWLLH